MPALELTPAERRAHRAAAHHLEPVVMIGGDGLSDAVVREVDAALAAHGLVKVRVFSDDRAARAEALLRLCEQLDAAPVQHIGKLLVLWRPPREAERAPRDDGQMPGPRMVKILKFSRSGNHRPQVKKLKVLGNQRVTAAGVLKRARKRPTSIKKKVAG